MGFREQYGQMVEDALNAAVDNLIDAETIKKQLHEQVNKLVDDNLADFKAKIKSVIDMIDGEKDIPDVK